MRKYRASLLRITTVMSRQANYSYHDGLKNLRRQYRIAECNAIFITLSYILLQFPKTDYLERCSKCTFNLTTQSDRRDESVLCPWRISLLFSKTWKTRLQKFILACTRQQLVKQTDLWLCGASLFSSAFIYLIEGLQEKAYPRVMNQELDVLKAFYSSKH